VCLLVARVQELQDYVDGYACDFDEAETHLSYYKERDCPLGLSQTPTTCSAGTCQPCQDWGKLFDQALADQKEYLLANS
jgi:hypothetical protein